MKVDESSSSGCHPLDQCRQSNLLLTNLDETVLFGSRLESLAGKLDSTAAQCATLLAVFRTRLNTPDQRQRRSHESRMAACKKLSFNST